MVVKVGSSSILVPFSLMFTTFLVTGESQDSHSHSDYDLCSPFKCGNITFSFPFSSWTSSLSGPLLCGLPGYQVICDNSSALPAGIIFSGRLYQVKNFYPPTPSEPSTTLVVVDTQLLRDLSARSCNYLRNFTISTTDFTSPNLPLGLSNLTLFKCPTKADFSSLANKVVRNYSCDDGTKIYLWLSGGQFDPPGTISTPTGCNLIMVPVSSAGDRFRFNNSSVELVDVLSDGFPLSWPEFRECSSCDATGGRCGYDASLKRIVCFYNCSFVLIIVLLLAFRRRILVTIKRNQSTDDLGLNREEFISTMRSTLVTSYSYSDIKKMTNSFKEKLGQGGYGSVYKGSCQMAASCFATIGRIHHVHVINLLGFSWNGSKQALVYEYMPHGSLGDLLSDEQMRLSLGVARLLEIALGIARGIEYLHNGCEARILHLDIKPQNVLLDHNFNPKISDFGLAKVYSRSRSAVTMTAARGTVGYIAPEVFMRNLGNASHKSDVYSYGMLLLEIAEGRKNKSINFQRSTSSEAYFPDWIYEKLTEHKEVIEEDTCTVRKMVIVGLWCIQISPKDRPSMTRVVDMLSGNLDDIEIPPKPYFLSAPNMQHEIASDASSALPLTSDSH
ncbi:hypothetical protein K2173_001843 [Erythroxylum novogranatense]|uniref:non-specific serine/threonine protein kinase n=1 Tax=Erythroxylum novogranatense TaxID=1862640 RepID=A0AAV8TST7_9ROSI|nr:hypothetical protein K2173_001843 [Erythroxylum novogranatense]